MRKIAPFIMFLLVLPMVFSLGIAPAKREVQFQPGLSQHYEIRIINNERRDMDVVLSVDGQLHDYIILDKERISLTKDDAQKTIGYTITLPEVLEPGLNRARIIADETVPNVRLGEGYVTAQLSVSSFVDVTAPYPEKYVDANFDVVMDEEDIALKAKVSNRGTRDVSQLSADFSVFDRDKQLFEETTQERALTHGGSNELIATVKRKDIAPGLYSATATLDYDGTSFRLTKDFQIGSAAILINDFDQYFVKDKINELTLDIESAWNREIMGAFAQIYVFKNGKEVATSKSASFALDPYAKKHVLSYFDATGLAIGDYDATVVLHYGGDTTKKEKKITLLTKEEFTATRDNNMQTTLIVAFITLVIVFIVSLLVAMILAVRLLKR
ncbi:hypothetical protein HY639_03395 [Candidatus Woesearchaeota archaeon]|nr:hypothetical protein [Candidatus Woesearchaeota archaeon]